MGVPTLPFQRALVADIHAETLKSKDTQFVIVKLPKCLEGPHNTYDRSTNSSRISNTEAEATAGMGTAARMTRVRTAAKNAFTEPP